MNEKEKEINCKFVYSVKKFVCIMFINEFLLVLNV